MEADQALLEELYEAFNARDIEGALRGMHPDVDWPNGMEGGRVSGHRGVRSYWTRQWTMIDPHVEPLGFERDDAGRVVVTVHQVVRDLTGHEIVEAVVHHAYLIEGGLIRTMEIRNP